MSSETMFSLSHLVYAVHSDQPENQSHEKYVSVVEKIGLNVLNAKSLETQRELKEEFSE